MADNAIALLIMSMGFGASFAFGMVVVCRYFKWSPVNITINNYHSEPGL